MSKKVLIGLDKFYYAILNSDTSAGVSYQTPVPLRGALTAMYNPNSNVEVLFADDGPYDTAETIGKVELDMEIADISQEDYATLMGHTIAGGVLNELSTDQPIDVALGFRAKRSNSGYSYYWLLKGKFSKPEEKHETKGEKIKWQTPIMKGMFVARVFDSRFKSSVRDDANNFTPATATTWFNAVYGATSSTTAPAYLSSIPTANSTTATQTTNITIVFTEPIQSSSVTAGHFVLIQASSATTFSATLSLSTGGDTVTMTPFVGLTAAVTYDVILSSDIKDLFGNSMSATFTFEFKTT